MLTHKATITLLHFIDKRLRQMAIFTSLSKHEGKLLYSFSIKTNKILYDLPLYYIKQIYSMSLCICSVIDHGRCQNVVQTSVKHSAIASSATFLFLPHFDVISDLLLDRCTATWILFVQLYVILLLLITYNVMFSHSNLNFDYNAHCTKLCHIWSVPQAGTVEWFIVKLYISIAMV